MTKRPPSTPPDIPGFRYVELLGTGGFADVFKYEEIGLGSQQLGLRGRAVGVKVLLRGLRSDAQESFEAEAAAMAQLSNHPHIVSIFRAGQTMDGRAYLVMEYCPPPHLDAQIKKAPLPLHRALQIGVQIAWAVETAHRAGVLHRDIKPANILMTEFRNPALTDFGISASTAAGAKGAAVGMSVPWASPEQLTGAGPMGVAGDVYSLAATVYTMLAGRAPFSLPNGPNDSASMGQRIIAMPVPPLGRQDVPEGVERVLAIGMSKIADQRYSSALEFAHELQHLQTQLRQPVTDIPIVDAYEWAERDADDSGGTRVSGFESIDPELPGNSTRESPQMYVSGLTSDSAPVALGGADQHILWHGRGKAEPTPPLEFTAPSLPQLPDPPPAPLLETQAHRSAAVPKARHTRKALVGTGIAALAVAAGVFALRPLVAGQPGTTANSGSSDSARPKDVVGEMVPQVAQLTIQVSGSSVTASWVNPAPAAGDSYLYRIVDPQSPKDYTQTAQLSATLPAQPGRTCVEVVLRRANGRSANPVSMCEVTP